jgi:hypothetical protein
LIDQ